MKKDCGHTVRPRCFGGVKLLKCFSDFVSCENLGELNIHLLRDTSRNCINNLINTHGEGGGVYILEIGYYSGCNAFLVVTLFAIIIPQLQYSVFPPFQRLGMDKFCVSIPFSIPMNLATLPPYGLLTVQEIINLISEMVNIYPSRTLLVIHSKGVESSSFLLNLL